MSYLRDIMQKLGSTRPEAAGAEAGSRPPAGLLAADYRKRLEACSGAMLDYEWTWLEWHREDLELCRTNPTMLRAAGGEQHLEALIREAEACRQALEAVFAARGGLPRRHPHSVAPGEHAWELSNPQLRAAWGFTPPSA
jgi:hypothetical protein